MPLLLELLDKEGSILLESYGHQVGGHHLLFKFKDTLCKPVILREQFFYATAPDRIKRHIPAYYGLINVNYVKQPSGEIQVFATRKEQKPVSLPPVLQTMHRVPKCTTGLTIHSDRSTHISCTLGSGDAYVNPWASMCTKIMEQRLNQLGSRLKDVSADYMILENLTPKFHSPSILDLKVGTRQHGDDAPPIKVKKHIFTCANSTSKSLGVRMAGMQKFDKLRNHYVFYDKYFGKGLSEEEFVQALRFFLDNGVCFRSDLVTHVIRMLKDLQASIRTLTSFRYFSSSLLLIYDGAECPEDLCRRGTAEREEVNELEKILSRNKIAQVEHEKNSSFLSQNGNGTDISMDDDKISSLYKEPCIPYKDGKVTPPPCTNDEKSMPISSRKSETTPKTVEASPVSSSAHCNSTSNNVMSQEELDEVRRHMDLRMIDFAHSTHTAFTNDPIAYDGPDEGYLIGLESLIRIFQDMEACRTN